MPKIIKEIRERQFALPLFAPLLLAADVPKQRLASREFRPYNKDAS
jgi:hypothetical protein